ncbi:MULTISPECIES: ABC transporter permease subunit [Marinobacter]|uniref:ABC transporter permease subunit n=1 Tax=Marinobacter suaedae TaxID=3057675 RepID=A0ABT8VXZ4_9GAMM|nr:MULTISPECIES: ABC transporter permease subunit [unclassified Marinobacter]MDO3720846.1 ABC transporter permease subunit [Marinobacter sp. chi1]
MNTYPTLKKFVPQGRYTLMAAPFLWLGIFFLLPFLFVAKISVAEGALAIPPYTALIEWLDGVLNIRVSFYNFQWLLDDPLYIQAYWNSIKMAFWSTVYCLLIGYPMAYAIAKAPKDKQTVLLLLVLLPSWTSFLIRVYAWMGLLKNNGLINNALMWLGVINEPIQMLNTNFAVYIGVVYSYLPFMVLPLYANLVKHDNSLLEAAADLGAGHIKRFFTVTFPLSMNGVIAGSMLVFIPVVGEYVIPELLGGTETIMIGKVLWQEFFNNRDWPVASALALIMVLILLVPIGLFHRIQNKEGGL